jgi:hypothetical protein
MKNTLYACAFILSALLFARCTASSNVTESQQIEIVSGDIVVVTGPLSAGETTLPNGNYAVTDSTMPGYQSPHNTRVSDPYYLVRPHLSPQVPVNLNPHSRLVLTDVEDRTFFDYFAWQAFIGLVWPADPSLRGVPRSDVDSTTFKTYNSNDPLNPNRVPVVWETFREFDDVFVMDSVTTPESWDETIYGRPFKLDLLSKGQLNQAGVPGHPLVDQNRQYVRYNLQMNEVMYEFVRQNKWYYKGNLPKSPTQATLPPLPLTDDTIAYVQQPQTNTIITQPVNGNSITIKSAWRIMITANDTAGYKYRRIDNLSRYFVSEAMVQDPVTGDTSVRQVGLVGLHVVVKTPQFTQGIWSSFEHIDNVEAPPGVRASFHSDTAGFQKHGYSYTPAEIMANGVGVVAEAARQPVEVSRIYKIPNTPTGTSPTLPLGLSTVGLNAAYKGVLQGTVWENYQLVITQWPTDPTSFYAKPFLTPRGPKPDANQPKAVQDAYSRAMANATAAYPRWSGLPIPQYGSLNTTMETYFQNPPDSIQTLESTSCMGCHYGASDTDYVWGFKLRTFPQNPTYGFDQGRIHPADSDSLLAPANVED